MNQDENQPENLMYLGTFENKRGVCPLTDW